MCPTEGASKPPHQGFRGGARSFRASVQSPSPQLQPPALKGSSHSPASRSGGCWGVDPALEGRRAAVLSEESLMVVKILQKVIRA